MPNLYRHLPHNDQPGAVQAITFRLADSMPAVLRHEWEHLLELKIPIERRAQVQAYIDRGRGECILGNGIAAEIVEHYLLVNHRIRYELLAWVIMPNHIHVLVCRNPRMSLAVIVHDWKSNSGRDINRALTRSGSLWHRDYYDRTIRSDAHLEKAVMYIHKNPVNAGLASDARQYPFSSARFVPELDMTFNTQVIG